MPKAGIQQPLPGQMLHHRRAEAAHRAFLDGDQHLVMARQLLDQRRVQRLGEARIGDRGRQPARRQLVRRAQRVGQTRAQRQDRHAGALAQDAALAQLQHLAARRQRDPGALAARIAQRARPVVDISGGGHHVHQLRLVGRRHQHHARQAAEIGDVEAAGMRGAVSAHQPGAVHREAHRQALDRHVVHHLVVGALQEGRVDRAERLHALGRHARRRRSPRAARRCRHRSSGRETPWRSGRARCPTASPR